jgi:hypothetical protein
LKRFPPLRRRAFAGVVAALALAACAPNPNGMGVADFGTVTGRVVDAQSQQPISGATIAIGNVVAITSVPDQGGFVLQNVPVGTQQMTISAIGWTTYPAQVTVTKNQTTDVGVIGLVSSITR